MLGASNVDPRGTSDAPFTCTVGGKELLCMGKNRCNGAEKGLNKHIVELAPPNRLVERLLG